MNAKVVYYSRSGNTKKLADCIAQTVGTQAEEIGSGAQMSADVLFLGASVYWGGIDKHVRKFIAELDPNKVKKVVVFSTSAMAERAFPDIEKRLKDSGIAVSADNFYCRGKFMAMHTDRPNTNDLHDAAEFAKGVLRKEEN